MFLVWTVLPGGIRRLHWLVSLKRRWIGVRLGRLFGLLRLLCLNINSLLPREVALETIWGENDYFIGRSMDVFITKLRKYLKSDPNVKITNVHGIGFKLEVKNAAVEENV